MNSLENRKTSNKLDSIKSDEELIEMPTAKELRSPKPEAAGPANKSKAALTKAFKGLEVKNYQKARIATPDRAAKLEKKHIVRPISFSSNKNFIRQNIEE